MSVQTFKASHCGETFAGAEGAKALEAHMKAHRAAKRGTYYTPSRQPAHEPIPWAAPKPSPGGIAKVAQRIQAGEYCWPTVHQFPVGPRWSTANVAGEVA